MKKATLATLKSFIKNNRSNLHVSVTSAFDGMYDCCMPGAKKFVPATDSDGYKNTLGINGVWVVFGGDSVQPFEQDGFKGFDVYNCCGSFKVAIPA